ncbi:MAG: UDP-N-acetylmuramoyl-L-alanine--D-glutamate ligase [Arcobacter sp.]|nr:MAG: UDP-N-acetylmuramoyl-L-alanine--D-glutamate ligase [Arcobacter sp.]
MRILGKGKTGQAIQEIYKEASLFDDKNIDIYDKTSDEVTVVSPGIPPYNQLVKNTKNLISEYDLLKDTMPFTIWISGTNGKTTTTQMLQHLLSSYNSQCGGNIGVPLATMDRSKDIWILETSSFTLHYTKKAKPNIYVLLPVKEDHLSWHGSFKEYEKAKIKPLQFMSNEDIAILPSKFQNYPTKAKTIYYNNADDLAKKFDIDSSSIHFKEPFLLDALLALGVSKIITNKIDYKKINSFIQDPHKLEEFQDFKNRVWVDDSKATNIDATMQALKLYKEKKIFLILGGDDKGADLKPLFTELQKYNVELYLIGKNASKLSDLAKYYKINAKKLDTLEEAIYSINQNFKDKNNSIALLSPAAASLDQFSSYKERGEKFKKYVSLMH